MRVLVGRFFFALLFLGGPVVLAEDTPEQVLEELGLSGRLEVSLQGGLSNLPPAEKRQLMRVLKLSLEWARSLTPADVPSGFFSLPNPEATHRVKFRLILSDQRQISYRASGRFPVDRAFESWSVVSLRPLATNAARFKTSIETVLRIDKLMGSERTGYSPVGFMKVTRALMQQIHSYWQYYLDHAPEQIFRTGSKNPQLIEAAIQRRSVELHRQWLDDPRVLDLPRHGDLLGLLWEGWLEQADAFSKMGAGELGPFLPKTSYGLLPKEPGGLGEVHPEEALVLFHRAMHLVYKLQPESDTVFRVGEAQRARNAKGKAWEILLLNLSDARSGKVLAGLPFVAHTVPGLSSETFYLDGKKLPKAHFITTLWTDRLFFEPTTGKKRADSLARVTLALASETFGGVGNELTRPKNEPPTPQDAASLVLLHKGVLEQAVGFVHRLQGSPLWAGLSESEQAGFLAVKEEYVGRVDELRCAHQILKPDWYN